RRVHVGITGVDTGEEGATVRGADPGRELVVGGHCLTCDEGRHPWHTVALPQERRAEHGQIDGRGVHEFAPSASWRGCTLRAARAAALRSRKSCLRARELSKPAVYAAIALSWESSRSKSPSSCLESATARGSAAARRVSTASTAPSRSAACTALLTTSSSAARAPLISSPVRRRWRVTPRPA